MVLDTLENSALYESLHPRFHKAFHFLRTMPLLSLTAGKHPIHGNDIFALVQEYTTQEYVDQQMEGHKKYIDIQYVISGKEKIGHMLYQGQPVAKPYDLEGDYHLFKQPPAIFSILSQGQFMIFFPQHLHLPSLSITNPAPVKKIVVKVRL